MLEHSSCHPETAGYFAHYGELHTKGNIVAYSTSLSSDKNLKDNISPIGKSQLNLLDYINPELWALRFKKYPENVSQAKKLLNEAGY